MEGVIPHPDFWKARRVLVTGHTGFQGSWLCAWLVLLGAEVVGYSQGIPTNPSLFEAIDLASRTESIEGDVCDLDRVRGVLRAHRPDVVFHLAAQSIVRESYRVPLETFRTNVLGTATLFEALRREERRTVVVNATSDKCYLNKEIGRPFREGDELGGSDPYSASKACAELVTSGYRESFFSPGDQRSVHVALASIRAGNVIGGGDWSADRLVPDAIRGALAGQPLRIRNPDSVRPWQHVLDCLSGYLLLAEHLEEQPQLAGPWNLGPDPGGARTVSWIADRLSALWGSDLQWYADPADDGFPEASVLALDSSFARERLGWRPRYAIDETLALTVDWYRKTSRGDDPERVTNEQLLTSMGPTSRRGG